jgi:hypothetical protein
MADVSYGRAIHAGCDAVSIGLLLIVKDVMVA